MQQTTNYKLNKPELSDYADITKISENMDVIDAQLKNAQNHMENGDIHVTAEEKEEWNNKASGDLSQTVSKHIQNNDIHVTAEDKGKWNSRTVFPLGYSKSGTTHALTGLSGVSGTVSCIFMATANFAAGDTFTVDGTAYAIQLANGEEPEDNLFVSGAYVPIIVDMAGKKVNFKAAGGAKLPAETMAIVKIYTANDTFTVPKTGKYRITAIGHGGAGGRGSYVVSAPPQVYTAVTGGSGAGGGAGELVTNLTKGESYPITVDAGQSSFGSLMTATCGGNGTDAQYANEGAGQSPVIGVGGTKGTVSGYTTLLDSQNGVSGARGGDVATGPSGGGCNGAPGGVGGHGYSNSDGNITSGFPSVGVTPKGMPPFGAGGGATGAYSHKRAEYLGIDVAPGWMGAVIVEMALE